MRRQIFLVLFLFIPVNGVVWAIDDQGVAPGAFEKVLLTAISDPAQALSMHIECTDEKGIRSLHLYPEGVAIWNQRVQVAIAGELRNRLLNELLKAGFPSFETHYGGKENSGRIKAPNIVMCSIEVQTGGLEKASYQDVNGDRSAVFLELAATLLDSIEPLAALGIKADSMSDALNLLQQGRLAPQILVARVMRLPADATQVGIMIKIEAGQVSRRNYQPGVDVGDWLTAPLATRTFENLVQKLIETSIWSLPAALPSRDTYQMNITVLNHSVLIRSRALNNQHVQQKAAEGATFTDLADTILSVDPQAQTIPSN